jgi:hypothetical protein
MRNAIAHRPCPDHSHPLNVHQGFSLNTNSSNRKTSESNTSRIVLAGDVASDVSTVL